MYCPFENHRAALEEAPQQKIDKYEPRQQLLLQRFQKVVVEAVVAWLLEHDVLSRTKRFLPYDGVFEHNYVLQRRMDEVRTTSRDPCTGFLDLSNAFGCDVLNAIVDVVRDPLSSTLSGEDASAASSFEATTSVPAAIDSSQDTDVLNFHLKRLVIIEGDGDVTPGQGDLLSTHALPASATSGKSSRLCIG
ncbi:hypothetical protein IscW_ISCW010419 [Ixodes scapularis]|uniref:Uncharacterized protein n=1 Tax=Ixodes scapularis TaxID=6945 RepID=B7Q7E0_IXOSC|nr:hypothetical protein IscW_ISCW010419 [Ixodes scapularis]|eukprot:XP_002403931.1 hypothetical protein IscW_ISCW010419 [Ixodes scapularis]